MAEVTDLERRVRYLEGIIPAIQSQLASAMALAAKAEQDAQNATSGAGSSGGLSAQIIYTTSTMTARSGTTMGQVAYQIVNGVGSPPVLTATANTLDAGLTVFNLTGSTTTASGQYGVLLIIGGVKVLIVLDCQYTVNPAPPASP